MSIKRNTLGSLRVQLDPPEGSKLNLISINWCDKTTWYPDSEQVTGEELTPDGSYIVYTPAVSRHWVDVFHGKLTDERLLRSTYQPVIKVNDVTKTENSPGTTDGDYSINYTTGAVTFNSALTGTDTVTADYYYAQTSKWIIAPAEGKVIRVTSVELQFSENVDMLDAIIFQPYGYVEVFAPHLCPDPYPPGTKIPLGDPTVYQTMQDIINEASLSYPVIPKLGGTSWRGMVGPMHIFQWPWRERGSTDIYHKWGMEVRVSIENDVEFGGDVAINTFYAVSEDEPS